MTNREQPDPGDGWRWLTEGEVIIEGDEYQKEGKNWLPVLNHGSKFYGAGHWPMRRPIVAPSEIPNQSTPPQPDLVNAPPHYRQGDIECIDAIRAALTHEEFRGFCKGNVIKYTWRERHKGGDADLGKAVDYLDYAQTNEVTK